MQENLHRVGIGVTARALRFVESRTPPYARLQTAHTQLALGSHGDGMLPQNLIVQLNAEPRLR